MGPGPSCPEIRELQRFALGEVSEREMEALEQHLSGCCRCVEAMHTLPGSDTLVEALRGQPKALEAEDAPVQQMIRRMDDWQRPAAEASAEQTAALGEADSAAEEASVPRPPPPVQPPEAEEVRALLGPAQGPDEIGRLGGYVVVRVIGAGGMGIVLEAHDPGLRRRVALKVMRPALAVSAAARQRFLREAEAAATVEHDHIIHINQVGEDRGVPFVAMPLLRGESLEDRLRRDGLLPVPEALRIAREAAEGLAAAHRRGLIHRDVKPANIWLEARPGEPGGFHKTQDKPPRSCGGRVKLLDFGLARAADEAGSLTQPGTIVGTPAYMAPEQARGEAVDARSDLFSLGCVLYRLCTGVLPFRGATSMQVLSALALDQPQPPRALNPAVPPLLNELVMRLLAKRPDERPPSARTVIEVLEALEREQAATNCLAPAGSKLPRRRSRLVVALIVAAGLLLAGGIIYVKTDNGTLKIETYDIDARVVVEQDGRQVHVIDTRRGKEVRLHSGEYRLRLGENRKDVELAPGRITLKRGRTVVATITRVAPPAAKAVEETWIEVVSRLPAPAQVAAVAAKLKERNPGFDGKVKPTIEGEVVVMLELSADDVTDLSPVRALPGLRALGCRGSDLGKGRLADLSPLKGLPLTMLECNYTRVADLAPLQGMPLRHLSCYGTGVAELSPLRGMRLTFLNCDQTRLADLAPLEGIPLTSLHCGWTKVASLAPLKGMRLERLVCPGTRVSDLSPLRGMPLTELACHRTPIADLSPLRGMPLKELLCDFQPGRDAAILRSIKTLEKINNKPAAQFWKEVDSGRRP